MFSLKNIFRQKYHLDLVALFEENALIAAISANIIVPLIFIYVMHTYIPFEMLIIWFLVSISIALVRIYSAKKLKLLNSSKYLNYIYITILFAGVLWSVASLLVFLYAPKIYLLFIAILIVGINTGAITTMSMIYVAFFIFVITSSSLLVFEFLYYYDDKLYLSLSILLLIFALYLTKTGYKYYLNLKEAFILKDKLKVLNTSLEAKVKERTKELDKLNASLEERVAQEIENNRKKDQQLLQQSRQAQMGEMISMIAHQWRQPLGAISATSIDLKMKLMLSSYDLDTQEGKDECTKYFDEQLTNIESFVDNLTTTIDDFRNFYKPNKDKKSVTINEPIIKSLNIIRQAAEAKGISFKEEYNSKKVIPIYDSELMQVFLNIFKNAQDNFVEKGISDGKIDIITSDLEDCVEVKISDNGGGIPTDIIEKIFDPYFSTKNEKNGTGLGLYMSKTIVEEHHKGKIEAINIDNGVEFRVKIFT